jgi:ribosomal protein S18 acetylase RimI-like enzyme
VSNPSVLLRLQDALVESTSAMRDTTRVGGYVVMLTPDDPLVWLNYAVPVSEAAAQGVEAMTAVFQAADRTPRLEFFPDVWPGVAEVLDAQGFVCEKRMPIMVLEARNWAGLKSEIDVRDVDVQTFGSVNAVLAEAFGMPPAESSDPLADPAFERIASGATLAAAALVEGVVVGGGFAVGTTEVREIAGIGTGAAFRRRGVASAVIAHLLDRFFNDGGELAWLTPGDDGAESVYSRLGFETIGEQVCYVLPSGRKL